MASILRGATAKRGTRQTGRNPTLALLGIGRGKVVGVLSHDDLELRKLMTKARSDLLLLGKPR
jgi:hypothetical protein